MPPAKKAAKKAPKKAAKHHPDKQHEANDLRRAYEHMGRLEVLQKSLKSSAAEAVSALAKLAQRELESGHNKDTADLLRASEQLSFAALAGASSEGVRLSAELEHSITEHFDELTRRADEHWEDERQHSRDLPAIYQSSRKS